MTRIPDTTFQRWEIGGTGSWIKRHIVTYLQPYVSPQRPPSTSPPTLDCATLSGHPDYPVLSPTTESLNHSSPSAHHTNGRPTTSVHHMPPEILGKIFEFAIASSDTNLPMRLAIEETCRCLYHIASVCWTWRTVALDHTSLWSLIPLVCYRLRHKTLVTMHSATLGVERAGNSSLRFAADLGLFIPTKSLIIERLAESKHHISYVNLRISGYYGLEEILNPILEANGERSMTELSLCLEPSAAFIHERPDPYILFQNSTPSERYSFEQSLRSLQILRLKNVVLCAPNASFTNLRWLRLQGIMTNDNVSLVEALKVLETAYQLERLELVEMEVEEMKPPMPYDVVIPFPNLKTLYIKDVIVDTMQTLLCCIKPGPHQTFLSLSSSYLNRLYLDEEDHDQASRLRNATQPHRPCALVVHDKEGAAVDPEALRALLCRLPDLAAIHFRSNHLSPALFAALTYSSGSTVCPAEFPRFRQLLLSCETVDFIHESQNSLIEFFSSHPLEELILGGALRILSPEASNSVTGSDYAHSSGLSSLRIWLQENIGKVRMMERADFVAFESSTWQLW
ncbi:hypothetical protein RSOLAG1IB_10556 [Rhizoctonia solani AG-1 IB]|uniref:F-box domain-containing protein n=1 Tax=Thanatephorus cucumeris (strain AG1-IB / isolate 7/3/14) TaxID=1108050 RepID=A0A0B7G315_THACB|nr:hypothetical protein RSOLAG1IB_10556 [Rhizoctonia solani AG-1 IB]